MNPNREELSSSESYDDNPEMGGWQGAPWVSVLAFAGLVLTAALLFFLLLSSRYLQGIVTFLKSQDLSTLIIACIAFTIIVPLLMHLFTIKDSNRMIFKDGEKVVIQYTNKDIAGMLASIIFYPTVLVGIWAVIVHSNAAVLLSSDWAALTYGVLFAFLTLSIAYIYVFIDSRDLKFEIAGSKIAYHTWWPGPSQTFILSDIDRVTKYWWAKGWVMHLRSGGKAVLVLDMENANELVDHLRRRGLIRVKGGIFL